MDTVTAMPIAKLSQLHMDPEGPVPARGDGEMTTDVDNELIGRIVAAVVGTPILSAEIRHVGGAVARARARARRRRGVRRVVLPVRGRDGSDTRGRRGGRGV